ncbi:MAG: DNA-binding protein [Candidatus Pacebacteria bacterium CG_4_10_14_3_um_filter_34_15]|nr:KilA-N domain-containing protein [Candidatus Pacearchaeota archaeon]NCQ65452.1 KilA-N domain-containing protein [Candidatus Paceibacterota bacterium]OIO45146.1 MAG: DNA-binding protein [Candidatus Pacebacteria bacterium CG1_02_43_31]PIQ81388.1 MAG: DNA-binding protein [Candidatus Pacebacteria bacterium CG11_big_fil_rev_8_21_14_0_20_34_55]PIX81231.1 MAG: DNA-binding protein [Candidatus Pacebacteria bacterium CG_4_10_14_3_um_filter_34_15]
MVNLNSQRIVVKNTNIVFFTQKDEDYISLTDIAKYKNKHEAKDVVKNWLKNKNTIEFLGLWEKINNTEFKGVEFDSFKFESGSNSFTLSPTKWIKATNAIGIISKSGHGGGTFAHKDIAFEFASWISSEFKLYLIKEFQRLKEKENSHQRIEWNAKRFLVRANYKVHTDSVQQNLIPSQISRQQTTVIYASEADVLNVALFSITAKQWREKNPNKKGNIRDHAGIFQLVCLAGLESLNAEFIRQGLKQNKRLERLNQIAIIQMKSLIGK